MCWMFDASVSPSLWFNFWSTVPACLLHRGDPSFAGGVHQSHTSRGCAEFLLARSRQILVVAGSMRARTARQSQAEMWSL